MVEQIVLKAKRKVGGSQWESEDAPARSATVSETYNLAETGKAVDLSQSGTRGCYTASVDAVRLVEEQGKGRLM